MTSSAKLGTNTEDDAMLLVKVEAMAPDVWATSVPMVDEDVMVFDV